MFRSFTIKPSSGLTSTSSNSHLILTSLRFQISSTGTYDPDNEPEHSTITERTPPLNLHTNPHEDQGHKNLSRLHGIETFPPHQRENRLHHGLTAFSTQSIIEIQTRYIRDTSLQTPPPPFPTSVFALEQHPHPTLPNHYIPTRLYILFQPF